jgi:hypothetical protein
MPLKNVSKEDIKGFIEKIKGFIPDEYDLDINIILYSFDSKLSSKIDLYDKKRNKFKKILENIPLINTVLSSYAMEIYVPDNCDPKDITKILVKPKYRELADDFAKKIRETYGANVSLELA